MDLADPRERHRPGPGPLPGGNFVVGRLGDPPGGGELVFLDMSNGFPALNALVVSTTLNAGGASLQVVGTGGTLYAASGGIVLPDAFIEVYDISDQSSPVRIARTRIPATMGSFAYFAAARGRDVLVVGDDGANHSAIFWCRFSADYQSLALLGTFAGRILDSDPIFVDDFAIVAASGSDSDPGNETFDSTIVLRLDSAQGLVETLEIPAGGVFPRILAADTQRGLLYGAGYGLEILDLGILEGEPPRWP